MTGPLVTFALIAVFYIASLLVFTFDFMRRDKLGKNRDYTKGYATPHDRNISDSNIDGDKYIALMRDIVHSPQKQYQQDQERATEGVLLILSSGGLVWLSAIFQGSPEKIQPLFVVGGGLLFAALTVTTAVRAYLLNRSYFERGEWEKNCLDFLNGAIDSRELLWRGLQVSGRPKPGLAALALISLGFSIFGISIILAAVYAYAPAT